MSLRERRVASLFGRKFQVRRPLRCDCSSWPPEPKSVVGERYNHDDCPGEEVRMSSPLKRLTRKVFERHSNPWSAWTRLLSTPLVFVPFWTRSWKHAYLVGGWMLLNPIVFPKPEDDSAWATKAMLGEEMWIAERPLDKAMAVNAAGSWTLSREGCCRPLSVRCLRSRCYPSTGS
jgi:hypothetical protein